MCEFDSVDLSGNDRAFTVVEVVVAVAVLLVGLLSVVGVFNDSRDQNATGERTEIALLQAEQAIEEMRGTPYSHLLLSGGASDPTGGQRVLNAGANFKVKENGDQDVVEPLVYYTTEGKALADAWVDPTSQVSIGTADAHLDLTIYRFISWRDEECSVANLGELGTDLPAAIQTTSGLVTNAVNSITSGLLGVLNPTLGNKTTTLKNRLSSLNGQLGSVSTALAGVSQLDLCDADLSVLEDVQRLDRLEAQLPVLDTAVTTLQNALNQCLPLLCNQTIVSNAVDGVNNQLNCMFNATGSSGDTTYLNGLVADINGLAGDVSHTVKNSKRITVAVMAAPQAGVAPVNPIWLSSVVRNPAAGPLTSGGVPCT